MVSAVFQMLGAALCGLGWIGTIIVCALPKWKVTDFERIQILAVPNMWEGIWMHRVIQHTSHCKVYDSLTALSADLQAARALIVISILLGVLGFLLCMVGSKCTKCVQDQGTKVKICVASGVVFILARVLCLIPVCWTTHKISRDFYDPLAPKRKAGASLFIGWGASALLIIGGALLCANCPPKDNYSAKYPPSRVSAPKDYI